MAIQRKQTEHPRSKAYLRFRARLLAGLLTMAAIAIAVVAWHFHSSYTAREEALRRQTQQFARAMEAHVLYAIRYADLSLIGFGNAIKVLPQDKPLSAATVSALLSSRSSTFTHDFWISFIDANGKGVAASNNLQIEGVDYTDRDYFQVHKSATSPDQLYIGGPMVGKISNQKLFYLSRRVESDDGSFLGIIVAPLDATRFATVFENSRITDDVSITLVHRNGRIIARAPNFETAFNADLSGGTMFSKLKTSNAGTFRSFSAFDQLSRMFSYRALENLPLIIAVGSNDTSGIWFAGPTFIIGSIGLALFLLVVLASGLFALKSYAKLEERELRYRLLYASSREMEESMKLAALMYQNSGEGMMVTDTEGKILSVNPAFSRISGYTEEEVKGHRAYELTSGRQDLAFFRQMHNALRQSGRWEGEVWHQNKDGEHYLVSLRFNAVFDEHGKAYRRVALFSDITKKKATEELIWKQANFDTLTGLPNRRMFQERLRLEMKKSDRVHLPMALVFIDLDGFKAVNDNLGHATGDVLLKEVADRLSHCVRSTDTVSRLGGDEFTVILGELRDATDVMRIAQQILNAMAEAFQLGKEVVHISASIGITLYPDDADDAEVLVKNADQAMYAAKQQGRNRYNYFAPFMQEANHGRQATAQELHGAVAGGQLRVLYQPIVELATGRICKAEALVRWQHPTRGLICPGEFIAIAEHSGAIVGIGDWVFRESARQVRRIQQRYDSQFQISVNNSAWQFREDGSEVGEWLAYLEQLQLGPRSIIIEVTENLLLSAPLATTRKLAAFHEAKMQLSLDDFGTGHGAIAVLKRYNVDYLKIDPAFICNLTGAKGDDLSLCDALIALAHKLGIQVIAEGIETLPQMAALKASGCDFGQGYLVSKPITGLELEEMLAPVDKPMDIHRTTCE